MNSETRQTMIGVAGIAVIQVTALMQDFNGAVTTAALCAVVALIAPEALDKLPILNNDSE
jgi:hypothetical protein